MGDIVFVVVMDGQQHANNTAILSGTSQHEKSEHRTCL
jgi:hypothetical protein